MAKVIESLRSISAYPVPDSALETIAVRRGVQLTDDVTGPILRSDEFRLAEADVRMWLSTAPTITQGGISYSFSSEERLANRQSAEAVYAELDSSRKSKYGYQGSRL